MSSNCCAGSNAGRLSGNGDFRSGRTVFDQLAISLKTEQGMVSVDDMHIDGPAVRLAVGGQASVPTRDLDLKGWRR